MRISSRVRRSWTVVTALALAAVLLAGCGSGATPAADVRTPGASDSGRAPIKVGIFLMASAALLDDVVAGFKKQFLTDTGRSPDEVTWVERNAQGDASLIQSIARELAGQHLDMITVIGTPAVLAMAQVEKKTPIIALAMGDPVGAGVAKSLDAPGGNVTGSIDYIEPAKVLDEMLRVSPAPKRLGTIYDPSNQNLQVWVADLKKALPARGLSLVEATVATPADVDNAARSLIGRVDAILIGPDATVIGGTPAVAAAARRGKVPLYLVGGDASEPGVLATLGPDYPQLGALGGAVAAKVDRGTPPGEVPFARPGAIQWGVNTGTAKALGVTLPSGVATP
jgi:putative ABC transport system substrate-binding protein